MAKSSGSGKTWLAVLGGLGLMMVAWKFPVPMYPESTTLVSLIAVVIGMLVGWKESLMVTSLYLVAIVIDLPPMLWGGHAGLEPFMDIRSNGFVLGLLPAGAIAGHMAPKAHAGYGRVFGAALAGHGAYLAAGLAWFLRFMPPHEVLTVALPAFLIPVLAKTCGAFAVAIALRKWA